MKTRLMRILVAIAAASCIGALFAGCDGDNVEVVGIGVSTGLPGNTMTGSNEIGVGNVNWVGNPRW
jgi:hypothetical protein